MDEDLALADGLDAAAARVREAIREMSTKSMVSVEQVRRSMDLARRWLREGQSMDEVIAMMRNK